VGFDTHANLFIEESLEILDRIELPLMGLVENPERQDYIDEVFRAMHTIKGSGSMFGFTDISQFVHNLETAFDDIRKGKTAVSREIIELTLNAKDRIRELLLHNDSDDESVLRNEILSRLADLTGHTDENKKESLINNHVADEKSETDSEAVRWRIRFSPSREVLLRGVRLLPLFDELCSLGECSFSVDTADVPDIEDIDPEHLYFFWDIDCVTTHPVEDIRAVFIFVEDDCEINISRIEELSGSSAGAGKSVTLEKADAELPIADLNKDLADQRQVVKGKEAEVLPGIERRKADLSSIRVKNEKLDTLVNLVGELVTLHARMNQEATNSRNSEFVAIAEALGRLADELRNNTMNIRMVPLSEMFTSFNRLVFELSHKLGKKISLVTTGGQTELDKNVIEGLRDPLMHLIRNSTDHGIELPEARRANGKNEKGTITLSAEYSGSNVVIRVIDDGQGLDREKIHALAVERGLLTGDADDKTIYRMIFEPGFSTAQTTTDISGRGVGMDVVKRNIEKLRGTIDIQTKIGSGTELILTIPLTLAIIDGFMFEMGENLFVFNLSAVRECVEYTRSDAAHNGEQFTIDIRGELIPCIDLLALFRIPCTNWGFSKIIIVEYGGERYGFLVDRIIGKYQSVIKPIGQGASETDMISGATILGDGSVALMLDIGSIIRHITNK
jgi:two-component system chemotaxis sensor kinase CheA